MSASFEVESKPLKQRTLMAELIIGPDDGNGQSSMLQVIDIDSLYVLGDSLIVIRTKNPHPIESLGGKQIYGKPLSKEQREVVRSFFE